MSVSKRGQVTIFIIVAILIVVAVAGFFIFRGTLTKTTVPANLEPAYTSFLSCVEENTLVGIDVLESQGGYIQLPEFESGSEYMPFSSQLDFLGNLIPYWYYVSGNNIERMQVPSKDFMAKELETFIEDKISTCNFDSYNNKGFEVFFDEANVAVTINDGDIIVDVDMDLSISLANESVIVSNHEVVVASKLGALYQSALDVYDYEQSNLFLEDYGLDVLRLYAPVDGVELTCSPVTWNAENVFNDLEDAIESNVAALKTADGAYTLRNNIDKYFIVDVSVPQDVRFLNSKNWPKSFEVTPTRGPLLISEPVGNQPGLGIIGFCYAPYHFVYNVKYPVLVQVMDGNEIFQFPMAVIIQGNKARDAGLTSEAVSAGEVELCQYKNTPVKVSVYNNLLEVVPSEIFYDCVGTTCEIGSTTLFEPLYDLFPQCVGGKIIAKADGYVDGEYYYSTTEPGEVDIIMQKKYEKEVRINLGSELYTKDAIVTFTSDKISSSILYPEQTKVELAEGQYEVKVAIYRNSSLKLDGSSDEYCTEVPKEGLGAMFGLTDEKCFDIEIPGQVVSNALAGGGTEDYYILESELINSDYIEINAGSLPIPTTLEQLQDNYVLFESKDLNIYFK